ncbi:MAG: hypothetical protein HC813_02810 [Planctomycetes bacterium]|nr:hypothetical protein [Planctomycetota bacterium]
MRRYLRLYLHFLRFSFSRALEFRLDFTFRIFMDAVWYSVNLAFFGLLYRHTALLGGWDFDQVLVFAAAVFLMDAIYMTVFSNNMWWLPTFVNRGDLDYYLVRPVSSLFFLSVRDFAANSFVNLLMAGGILGWALLRYPGGLGAGSILLFLGLLLVGSFLHFVLAMLFTIPVFWMHSSGGVREIYWSVSAMGMRPHRIFTGWMLRFLTTILPLAFIVSVPVVVLFEGPSLGLLLHMGAVVAGAPP